MAISGVFRYEVTTTTTSVRKLFSGVEISYGSCVLYNGLDKVAAEKIFFSEDHSFGETMYLRVWVNVDDKDRLVREYERYDFFAVNDRNQSTVSSSGNRS